MDSIVEAVQFFAAEISMVESTKRNRNSKSKWALYSTHTAHMHTFTNKYLPRDAKLLKSFSYLKAVGYLEVVNYSNGLI